jgi:hypothetical protein
LTGRERWRKKSKREVDPQMAKGKRKEMQTGDWTVKRKGEKKEKKKKTNSE